MRGHGPGSLLVAAAVRAHARRPARRAPAGAGQTVRVYGMRPLVDRRPDPYGRRGQTFDGRGRVVGRCRGRAQVEERARMRPVTCTARGAC